MEDIEEVEEDMLVNERSAIASIDREIIRQLGLRNSSLLKLASLKNGNGGQEPPETTNEFFRSRRKWAERSGVSADLVENLFRQILGHSLAFEAECEQVIANDFVA